MRDENDADRVIGQRLRRYATQGAEQAPRVRFTADETGSGPRRSRDFLPPTMMFAGVAVLAVIVVLGAGTALRGIGTKPVSTPTPVPSESILPTASATAIASTPNPAPVITGVLPDADGSPPPGVPTLQGITIFDVAGATTSLGLSCDAQAQDPELGATFAMQCQGSVSGVNYLVRANFWGLDYIGDIVITVRAAADGGMIDPHAALPLFGRIAGAAFVGPNVDTFSQFIEAQIENPNCLGSPCTLQVGPALIRLQLGVNGARVLQLVPA